jgi:lipid-A-disaccharide synthase-like uncharacterized protein
LKIRKRWVFLIIILPMLAALFLLGFWALNKRPLPDNAIEIKIQLKAAQDRAFLVQNPQGGHSYVVFDDNGREEHLTPDAFAQRFYDEQKPRSWLLKVCNITSPVGLVWIGIGLLGQVLFSGRMIVQWLETEREKRSTVPVSFWWMSLVGASMLLVYFVWRMDPIGILGQLFGWGIYLRNLYAIYAEQDRLDDSGQGQTQGQTQTPTEGAAR